MTAGRSGRSLSPADASGLPACPGVSAQQADEAGRAARRDQAALSAYTAEPRARLLETLAELVEEVHSELVELAVLETHLTAERLQAELTRTTGQLRGFAQAVRSGAYWDLIIDCPGEAQPQRPDIRRIARPLGPVAVWPASNFPFAFGVLGGDTASALAAGCPVVVKAHPAHPATSEFFARIGLEALNHTGLPSGVLQVLHSADHSLSLSLVRHPDVSAAAFTGSLRGGRALHDAAAERPVPIPVYAEMGSLNPVFVTDAAIQARGTLIASDLAASITGSAGQLCTKPGVVVVPRGGTGDAFVRDLAARLAVAAIHPMLTTGIQQAFERQISDTRSLPGVTAVLDSADAGSATLLEVDDADLEISARSLEEHFGPASVAIRCGDTKDFISVLHRLAGGLTATLFCEDGEMPGLITLWEAMAEHAGRLLCNQMPTGVPVGWATVHGGPYPATTASATTSVGLTAVRRFQRAVAYQNTPQSLLPAPLRNDNPDSLMRLVNGVVTTDPIPGSDGPVGTASLPRSWPAVRFGLRRECAHRWRDADSGRPGG
jgi:NADP-dependent aldehyde dehydrogenase